MNVLCIGSGVVGGDLVAELISAFLAAEFDGGERYRRRLDKIEAMEREGLNV
jgi:ribose 5-phosphate isomerase B